MIDPEKVTIELDGNDGGRYAEPAGQIQVERDGDRSELVNRRGRTCAIGMCADGHLPRLEQPWSINAAAAGQPSRRTRRPRPARTASI